MATLPKFSEFWDITNLRAIFPENFKFLALTVMLLARE